MNINDFEQPGAYPQESLWQRNPSLTYLLGLSPLLAMSSTAGKGIALGMITALTTLVAVLVHRLCYKRVKPVWRFVWYLFLLASIVTAIDLLLQLTRTSLHRELGLYLPLVACNLATITHLEFRNQELTQVNASGSILPTVFYSSGLMLAISLFSILRELVVFGSVLRDWQLLISGVNSATDSALYSSSNQLLSFGLLQPGAFIFLGLLLAAKNILDRQFLKQDNRATSPEKVERARVTGKL